MIRIKKIREFLKRFIWFVGKKPNFAFFILVFLAFVFGGFIFYKYSFLVEKMEPEVIELTLKFKEDLFQKVLGNWQVRQKKFEEAALKEHPDLFRVPVSIPEETEELTE